MTSANSSNGSTTKNAGKSCVGNKENTFEPPERDDGSAPKKKDSPYTPVKYAALLFGGLWLFIVALILCDPIGYNAQGEYCDYVEPGEPYDLIHEGYPCRLTSQLFLELGLALSAIGIVLQIPTLILWALQAYRKHLEALSPADLQRRYDEMIAANRWRDGGRADE